MSNNEQHLIAAPLHPVVASDVNATAEQKRRS